MSDPTALPPPLILVSGSGRLRDGPTGAPDDGTLVRLVTWLAEVSADAARGATTPAANATPAAAAPRRARGAEPPVAQPSS